MVGFGILGLEEVVEEIFAGFGAETLSCLCALGGLSSGLGDEVPAVVGEFSDEDVVELPCVEGSPETALDSNVNMDYEIGE